MDAPQISPKSSPLTNRYFVIVCLAIITLIGAYFRFVGVNWDENTHQHPDERFMAIVAEQIRPVDSLSNYFDPEKSSLNPFEFGSYTYGMLPLFLVRYIGEGLAMTSYDQIALVGRVMSGLFDLAALWVLYLIGARLYNRWIGLLATGLYAAAVVPIQLSHYFTVDSFTTVFLLGAIYCVVLVMENPRWWQFGLFGVLTGMAMSTKVSIAPLSGLILVAGIVHLVKAWPDPEKRATCLKKVLPGIAIAGFFTALSFRIFQPYAFNGPGFFGLSLNQRWLTIIREVSEQVAGQVDYPPNHHWAGRPWSYGWSNMVRWGMGIPLGLIGTIGWFWALWRIWKGEWKAHLLPVLWAGGFFFWQSSHFWRYTRYYLPIYPLIILLAAWALFEAFIVIRRHPPAWLERLAWFGKKHFRQNIVIAVIVAVVAGTYSYAFAFIQIYRHPHTRVAASNWMLEEIPGPFKVLVKTAEGLQKVPLGQATNIILKPGETWTGTFSSDTVGALTGISTPYFSLTDAGEPDALLTFTLAGQNDPSAPTTTSTATLRLGDGRKTHEIELPEFAIEAGKPYELTVKLESGGPLEMSGAAIAVESRWDDALPLSVGGIYAYPGLFQQLNLELDEPDTDEKRQSMLALLQQADYIVVASNRAYDAMPRMPQRFPMTLAYYQALFDCDSPRITNCAYPAVAPMKGGLGFDLVATFESYPSFGPIPFPDQTAQESFTVYDHPKVLIFQKSGDFSLDQVRTILEGVDLNQIVEQTALQFSEAPTALEMQDSRMAAQKSGGTWSGIFSPASVLNRVQSLGVIGWYLLLLLIGWFAFPIVFFAFRGLPDRGYGLSRLVGLLIVGWIAWFGSSYKFFAFTRLTLWFSLGLLWILGAAIAWLNFDLFLDYVKRKWRHMLTLEMIFLALFLFALLLRWYNPDLWHPWRGGEKPGDLALFHAVLKTVYFPPYDPWMAGNFVNYFYFGYVLAAVPTKLLGILPEVAYNLLIPTWFGLTGLGLFSVAYNLTAQPILSGDSKTGMRPRRLPYLAGSTALVIGLLLGNLAEAKILWEQLPSFAPDRISEPNLLEQAKDASIGLGQILMGKEKLFQGDHGIWYFDASRAILSGEASAPITEFPYFSFLYADLHPHLLGMPVVLCGLAWLLSFIFLPPLLSKQSMRKDRIAIVSSWLIGGLVVGATYPTNTWDFPAVLGLGVIAIGFASWRDPDLGLKRTVLKLGLHIGLLISLAFGLFAPFRQWFSTGPLSPKLWPGPRTPLIDYLTVHGLFVFLIVTFLLIETWHWIRPALDRLIHTPLGKLVPGFWKAVIALAGIVLAIIFGGWLWRNDFQTVGFVIILGLWAGGLLLQKGVSLNRKITLILIGAGLGLSLIAELVTVRGDVGRMNVVFKSYLLVWFFFSIACGAVLSFIWSRIRFWKIGRSWLGALGVLVIAAGAYPLTGTLARIDDRWPDIQNPPLTLNGMAFMNGEGGESENGLKTAVYVEQDTPLHLASDYQVFLWMRRNIQGTPTIVEGHTSEYRWGSRYSVYTGLPTVVGWSWHLRQHDVVLPSSAIEKRIAEVNDFYNTPDPLKALSFIKQYNVDLIVVGELERAIYAEDGVEKFAQMAASGDLKIIYPENGEIGTVNIFAVP